jgi:hypothetical protein
MEASSLVAVLVIVPDTAVDVVLTAVDFELQAALLPMIVIKMIIKIIWAVLFICLYFLCINRLFLPAS